MRLIIQRVAEARVEVANEVVGEIGMGLLLLVGIEESDSFTDIEWLCRKVVQLRIFSDEQGVMNRALTDVGGQVLAVSQFTLFASTRKGNRPSWSRAARGDISQPLFNQFVAHLSSQLGQPVATGRFGADMQVHLVNDGPVTLFIDSRQPE